MVTSRVWFTSAQKAELWERGGAFLRRLSDNCMAFHQDCVLYAQGDAHLARLGCNHGTVPIGRGR